MKRKEYAAALKLAMAEAGVTSEINSTNLVRGDTMTPIAMKLPTEVLKAIINREIVWEDEDTPKGAIALDYRWIQACDDELVDRILIEADNEGKELQKKATAEEGTGEDPS